MWCIGRMKWEKMMLHVSLWRIITLVTNRKGSEHRLQHSLPWVLFPRHSLVHSLSRSSLVALCVSKASVFSATFTCSQSLPGNTWINSCDTSLTPFFQTKTQRKKLLQPFIIARHHYIFTTLTPRHNSSCFSSYTQPNPNSHNNVNTQVG